MVEKNISCGGAPAYKNSKVINSIANTALLDDAAEEYIARRKRMKHPEGKFDNAHRFWPDDDEWCECCDEVRSPSRAFPNSLNSHCRSMNHIANLFNVDLKSLRVVIKFKNVEGCIK